MATPSYHGFPTVFFRMFLLLLAITMCSQTHEDAEYSNLEAEESPVTYIQQDSRYLKGDTVFIDTHASEKLNLHSESECRLKDSVKCFKYTVLSKITAILSQSFIPVMEGVAFVKDVENNSSDESVNTINIEKTSSSRNMEHFISAIWNTVTNFIQSHSLKVLIPETPISSPFVATGKVNKEGNLEFGVELPGERETGKIA